MATRTQTLSPAPSAQDEERLGRLERAMVEVAMLLRRSHSNAMFTRAPELQRLVEVAYGETISND